MTATQHDEFGIASLDVDPMTALLQLLVEPDGIADPHSRYRLLHEQAPVLETPDGSVFLSRYEDCHAMLRDNRFVKADRAERFGGSGEVAAFRREQAERAAHLPSSMLMLNPPDHTRIRGLVSRAFTPRRVEQLRHDMVGLVDECFDTMAEKREFDLLEELGFRFPVAVIGQMLGVPRADWPMFREMTATGAQALEPSATVEQLQASEDAGRTARRYFLDLLADKRKNPGDDLISAMLEVSDGSDRLTEDELVTNANLMFAAGFETTTNLIGNGMGALFLNPGEMDRLWADSSLASSMVEETLRWDSPVQLDGRTASEDVEIGGVAIAADTQVRTLLGAANRDPSHFTDPDRFDITRDEGPAMSFASGIHYCLGANLSRAEGQVVFGGLVERFASIELTGELVNRPRLTLRGYETVPVAVTPR